MSQSPIERPPRRVVSLVPSMTESLFDLGLGACLVGITDYCTQPARLVSSLPRVGGPKNPRLEEIIQLQPDLVIANQEENTPHTVHSLEEASIRVWLTFPQNVQQSIAVLWELVRIFQSKPAAQRLESLQAPLSWLEAAQVDAERLTYFCPIWMDETAAGQPWWMTFNHLTYTHDILRLAGGANVFAERERRYPLDADLGRAEPEPPAGRDTRYPRVTREEIVAAQPELILLPSEPYKFEEQHIEVFTHLFADTPAGKTNRIHFVDGSLITWHGTRLGLALRDLPSLFEGS